MQRPGIMGGLECNSVLAGPGDEAVRARALAKSLQEGSRAAGGPGPLWPQGSAAAPAPEQAMCAARQRSRLSALHLADTASEPEQARLFSSNVPRPMLS